MTTTLILWKKLSPKLVIFNKRQFATQFFIFIPKDEVYGPPATSAANVSRC